MDVSQVLAASTMGVTLLEDMHMSCAGHLHIQLYRLVASMHDSFIV